MVSLFRSILGSVSHKACRPLRWQTVAQRNCVVGEKFSHTREILCPHDCEPDVFYFRWKPQLLAFSNVCSKVELPEEQSNDSRTSLRETAQKSSVSNQCEPRRPNRDGSKWKDAADDGEPAYDMGTENSCSPSPDKAKPSSTGGPSSR